MSEQVYRAIRSKRKFGGETYKLHTSSVDQEHLQTQGKYLKNNGTISHFRTVKLVGNNGEIYYALYVKYR